MKDKCVYMRTSGDNVICSWLSITLGDIMGYDGYLCKRCRNKKMLSSLINIDVDTSDINKIASYCSKHNCNACVYNEACELYAMSPLWVKAYVGALLKIKDKIESEEV